MEKNPKPDLSLKHLEAELMRIDVLLHREVWRWQQTGQDINDVFRGQYVSDNEAIDLVKRPFATSWGQTIALNKSEKKAYDSALKDVNRHIAKIEKEAEKVSHRLRLNHLVEIFELDRFSLDTLLICLAPTLDLAYEKVYGYLQDDVTKKRPTVNLILNSLSMPGGDRLVRLKRFLKDDPLFRQHILFLPDAELPSKPPLLGQTLAVDETVVSWLLGEYQPHSSLREHTEYVSPKESKENKLLANSIHEQFGIFDESDESIENEDQYPLLVFDGKDFLSQRAAVHHAAVELGRDLIEVDLAAAIKSGVSVELAVVLALRDAKLIGAIPFLLGWDACLQEGVLPTQVFENLCDYPDWIFISGENRWQAAGIERYRRIRWVKVPNPAYSQRMALWKFFLGKQGEEGKYDIPNLAGQFLLTSDQIRDAVATAVDMSAQSGKELTDRDLMDAARFHSSPRLSSLAMKIEPRYSWDDIVLPGDQMEMLKEIIGTVRGRPIVLEEWGVGKKLTASSGITILFAGPPGTGKTMAAEVIAGELGLDLYKINLATIISKFIGETEKNLEKIFNEAENSNAILFFDEADALFGKRSEVKDSHDRYANIEISYLLQRMELYNGVTILATNLRANLDEAFTRRLQFAVDFPFPDHVYRLQIWETLFPPGVPRDAKLNFEKLAVNFKLAGGNIRNVIVSAAYLAVSDGGKVTMDHLMHSTRRELQKMGRLISEEEFNPKKE